MEEGLDETFSFGPIDRAATASANCGIISSRKETHGAASRRLGHQSYSQDVTEFKSRAVPMPEMGRPPRSEGRSRP